MKTLKTTLILFTILIGIFIFTQTDAVYLSSVNDVNMLTTQGRINIQKVLNETLTPSPNLKLDGKIGPITRETVKKFQSLNNLLPDGKIGLITRTALFNASKNPIISVNSVCSGGALFDVNTGKPCSSINQVVTTNNTSTYPIGCVTNTGFSTITGLYCGNTSVTTQVVSSTGGGSSGGGGGSSSGGGGGGSSSSDTTRPIISSFDIASTSSTLSVSIDSFVATDNKSVTGYLISESSSTPNKNDVAWVSSVPTTYTFSTEGSKVIYAWAKDDAGNISTSVSDSTVITLTSLPTVPTAPTSVSASSGNAQAVITFTSPSSSGGSPITSYVVTSSPGSITASGSASPIIVTGLTNNISYTFTVVAVNAVGQSQSSSVSNTVIPSAPSSNTFYVSYSSGLDTNDGMSPSTPWKTIAKVNAQTFTPGATILFKKGDTWNDETLTISSSGNSSNHIIYSSYGSGSKPIISGFTTLSGWTNEGSGIYSKIISPQSFPNMVTVNNVNTPIGRWPNSGTSNGGYMTIDSHVSNTSITDSALSGTPSWTGGEVVIRKNRYIIDRNTITNHSGSTINYSSSSVYDAIDGYGYFIQNDLDTLDQLGEWHYNSGTGKFSMYFGGANPTSYTVKVSTRDELISSSSKNYIDIDGLGLEGSNVAAIRLRATSATNYVSISDCSINFSGTDAIYADGGNSHLSIDNCTISNSNNTAIYIGVWQGVATGASISNNKISYSGSIPGMGGSGDGKYEAINLSCDSSTVEYNTIDQSGFNGIKFSGERTSVTINNNFVTNSCSLKDDCAGIYSAAKTYNNHPTNYVQNNIILGSIGNHDGVPSGSSVISHGIYLDDSTENTSLLNNTLANNAGGGIFLGYNSKNSTLNQNTSYNNKYQLWTLRATGAVDPSFTITENIFFAKDLTNNLVIISNSQPSLLGNLDYNYYSRPLNDDNVFLIGVSPYPEYNLSEWQSNYSKDLHSHSSPVTASSTNDILFDYNESDSSKTVSLGSDNYVDVTGAIHSGSVSLAPYTSIVLIKTSVLGVSKYYFVNSMKYGQSSVDVKELQNYLIKAGYLKVPATGYFGPKTLESVKSYQKANNLKADGIIGPLTLKLLNK